MNEDVPGLFQEAQGLVATLRGVSEAKKLVDLLVPQDQSATLDRLKEREHFHSGVWPTDNVALLLFTKYVSQLRALVDRCQLSHAVSPTGMALAAMYLAATLPRDGGHAV